VVHPEDCRTVLRLQCRHAPAWRRRRPAAPRSLRRRPGSHVGSVAAERPRCGDEVARPRDPRHTSNMCRPGIVAGGSCTVISQSEAASTASGAPSSSTRGDADPRCPPYTVIVPVCRSASAAQRLTSLLTISSAYCVAER
jgi:hypothetical protein